MKYYMQVDEMTFSYCLVFRSLDMAVIRCEEEAEENDEDAAIDYRIVEFESELGYHEAAELDYRDIKGSITALYDGLGDIIMRLEP